MASDRALATMAGRVLIAGFPAGGSGRVRALLEAGQLGGVILFRRNLDQGTEAARALIASLVAHAPRPVMVAVDQEGGRVRRFREEVVPLPPMRQLAALGDVALTRRAGEVLGRQLRAMGFTMDMAPVLDVDTNPDNPIIGDRAFGTTPESVIEHALAFAAGLEAGGVAPCGKHFPGHGDTDVDSHLALPILRHDRERLASVELAPFAAATHLPAWMSAHVVYEALDPTRPATLSPDVLGPVARTQLGYDGVVISDDLEMKAVADHFGVAASAPLAIEAGCDMLLVCSDVDALLEAHARLIERASSDAAFRARLEEAAGRAERLLARHPNEPTDAATLRAALDHPDASALADELERRIG